MKKVLFVIDSLNCGGAEKSLVNLLSSFDYVKYSVDLLLFKRNGTFEKFLPKAVNILDPPEYMKILHQVLERNLQIRRFSRLRYGVARAMCSLRLRINNKTKSPLHTSQVIWKSIKSCIEPLNVRYDIAIAYSQGLPTYYIATKVDAPKKLCWINTDYNAAGYSKQFDLSYYSVFSNIVAVSDKVYDVMIETFSDFKNKIIKVYDIVNPKLLYAMAESDDWKIGECPGIKILTIGRMVPYKGYDLAVEACEKLNNEGLQFKWYIIGDGTEKEKIEDLIKQKGLEDVLILLGEQSNPYKFLKHADIYVQTSKFEGFGLTVAEAKIFNKPIVATDVPVMHEQLVNEQNGLIVDMNGEAIFQGIKRLINNVSLRAFFVERLSKKPPYSTVSEIKKVYKAIEYR